MKFLFIVALFLTSTFVSAQNIQFADANFKQYLLNFSSLDANLDQEISYEEALAATNMNISDSDIEDLGGIEHFVNLKQLFLFNSPISNVNLENNLDLEFVVISEVLTDSVDFSYLENLETLQIMNCSLENINISGLKKLKHLNLQFNELEEVDLSTNDSLISLMLPKNNIKNIDISNLLFLQGANLDSNRITHIDVINNTELNTQTGFSMRDNPLEMLCTTSDENHPDYFPNIPNFTIITSDCFEGEYTFIDFSDPNFKNALLNHSPAIDLNSDGEISTLEAAFFENISISDSLNITNLAGIEHFTNLTNLNISNNPIQALGIENNKELLVLNINNSDLDSVDLSSNTNLRMVTFSSGKLKNINLQGLELLTHLHLSYNSLKSIDLFSNSSLKVLMLDFNNLKTLDISNISSLINMSVEHNPIGYVNARNSAYLYDDGISIFNNTQLEMYCTTPEKVDTDDFPSMPNYTVVTSECFEGEYKFINFPDTAFKNSLLNHNPEIDINGDGEISTLEATFVSGLNLGPSNIKDLSGIKYFINLEYLSCSDNPIEIINLSHNTKLKSFINSNSNFETIDLSALPQLRTFTCMNGDLNALDFSNNPLITSIMVANNQIESINVSGCDTIFMFTIDDNQLDSIDLSDANDLRSFSFKNNNIKTLDVSNNIKIGSGQNDINGMGNPLELVCAPSQRVSVNIWSVPENTIITDDCDAEFIHFPDDSLKQALLNHNSIIDVNGDGKISFTEAKNITEININNNGISDLTGISNFVDLEKISAANNQISIFNPNLFTNLKQVNFNNNQLTFLDFSENTATLEMIQVNNNNLDSVNISGSPVLANFWANNNNIRHIDISNSPNLFQLVLNNNNLISIKADNCSNLSALEFNNNHLETIDLTGTTDLVVFKGQNNNIKTLNFSNQTKLFNFSNAFDFIGNPLEQMCVADFHEEHLEHWNIPEETEVSTFCEFGYVPFADSLLRKFIAKNTEVDKNDDGKISFYEASLEQHELTLGGLGAGIDSSEWFYDISGIEYFINTYGFLISQNFVSTLRLSGMENLNVFTLMSAELVSAELYDMPSLVALSLQHNHLTELKLDSDIKQSLTNLSLRDNQLESLDISDYENLSFVSFETNPLDKICVRPEQIEAITWSKDEHQTFDTLCGANIIQFENDTLKQAILNHQPPIDNNNDGEISYQEALDAVELVLSDLGLTDLTDLQNFTNLIQLDISFNDLQYLDISMLTELQSLIANNNQLQDIVFFDTLSTGEVQVLSSPENTTLLNLELANNNLSELDVRVFPNLDYLNVSQNPNLPIVCVSETQHNDKVNQWDKDLQTNWGIDCLPTSSRNITQNLKPAFPNPATTYIEVSEALKGIYTLSGQLMKSGIDQARMISFELTPGVYILRYQSGKNERLIVQ